MVTPVSPLALYHLQEAFTSNTSSGAPDGPVGGGSLIPGPHPTLTV